MPRDRSHVPRLDSSVPGGDRSCLGPEFPCRAADRTCLEAARTCLGSNSPCQVAIGRGSGPCARARSRAPVSRLDWPVPRCRSHAPGRGSAAPGSRSPCRCSRRPCRRSLSCSARGMPDPCTPHEPRARRHERATQVPISSTQMLPRRRYARIGQPKFSRNPHAVDAPRHGAIPPRTDRRTWEELSPQGPSAIDCAPWRPSGEPGLSHAGALEAENASFLR